MMEVYFFLWIMYVFWPFSRGIVLYDVQGDSYDGVHDDGSGVVDFLLAICAQ